MPLRQLPEDVHAPHHPDPPPEPARRNDRRSRGGHGCGVGLPDERRKGRGLGRGPALAPRLSRDDAIARAEQRLHLAKHPDGGVHHGPAPEGLPAVRRQQLAAGASPERPPHGEHTAAWGQLQQRRPSDVAPGELPAAHPGAQRRHLLRLAVRGALARALGVAVAERRGHAVYVPGPRAHVAQHGPAVLPDRPGPETPEHGA